MISKLVYVYSLCIFKKKLYYDFNWFFVKGFFKKKFNFNFVVMMDSSIMMDVYDELIWVYIFLKCK